MTRDCFSEIMATRRKWHNIFQVLRKKEKQLSSAGHNWQSYPLGMRANQESQMNKK